VHADLAVGDGDTIYGVYLERETKEAQHRSASTSATSELRTAVPKQSARTCEAGDGRLFAFLSTARSNTMRVAALKLPGTSPSAEPTVLCKMQRPP
jgi:hypothetical protein